MFGKGGRVSNFGIWKAEHLGVFGCRAFGFLKATGEGVKMFMAPVVGYGYFLESPKMA